MSRLIFKSLLLCIPFVIVASSHQSVDMVEVNHMPEDAGGCKDVELDLADDVDRSLFELEVVDFQDCSVLSVSPTEGHVIKVVKEADQVIFVCNAETEDGVYEVVVYEDEAARYVTVFSLHGISFFRNEDGSYKEIRDYQQIPKPLYDILPLKFEDGGFHPICGKQGMGDDEDYGHLASRSGNLAGSETCAMI